MPFQAGTWPIPKGRVKLPEPSTSDYIIPNSVNASSTLGSPADTSTEIILESFEQSNSWNIYSGTGTTITGTSYDSTAFVDGAYSLKVDFSDTADSSGYTVGVQNTLDLTDMSNLFAYMKAYGDGRIAIYDSSGNLVTMTNWIALSSTSFTRLDLDVSNLTGTYTVRIYVSGPDGSSGSVWFDKIGYNPPLHRPEKAIDNDTTTTWSPASTNPGEWISIDLGVPTICGGARVYWGANVPNAYRIQASIDAATWQDVYVSTTPPSANDWTEYSWPAVYTRYLRIIFDDPGTNQPEVAEFHYYSRIVERVAAEHGHGSGVERWKRGPRARRGFKKKREIDDDIKKHKRKSKVTTKELLQLIEKLKEYIDFKVPD